MLSIQTDKSLGTEAKASYGSYKTYSLAARHANKLGRYSYKFALENTGSEGINHTTIGDGANSEKDGFKLTTFSTFLKAELSELSSLSFANRTVYNYGDIDKGFGAVRDDRNYTSTNIEVYNRLEYRTIWLDGLVEPIFSFSNNFFKRDDLDKVDNINTTVESFNSRSTHYKWAFENHIFPNDNTKITVGLEHEKEVGNSDSVTSFGKSTLTEKKIDSFGYYGHMKNTYDSFFFSSGLRGDQHQWFGSHYSYKLSPGYYHKPTKTKVFYALSTGFKAPTITQIHSSSGNKDLSPEESLHHEIGLERIEKRYSYGFSFFRTKIEEKIEFENSKFFNIGESVINGHEFFMNLLLFSNFSTKFQFTRLKTEIKSNGLQLINRPNSSASWSLNHKKDWYDHNFFVSFKGRRDGGFEGSRVRLPSYALLSINGSYQLRNAYESWWSLDNLLDKKYTDVAQINSPGRNATVGLKKKF
ncbi:MAG: TonB-dependent receptor [Halobacteriovoraceae bacterium]|nr:TonB-dependent receptor [Halobacteriovoraceae bacterium]